MKIGLIDVDGHNWPNLALMKLSAWHKAKGDTVEWHAGWSHYDVVYMSKVFSDAYSQDAFTPANTDAVIRGGSGYAIRTVSGVEIYDPAADKSLPEAVEHMMPDYSLYPSLTEDTAYGRLTVGCPKRCAWCHVCAMQGAASRRVVDLTDQFARVGDALRTKSRSAKMVYVLANFGSSTPDDVLFRICILRSLNYDPYVMIYDKPNAQQIYLDLQRWCNNKIIFGAVEFFEDYNRM